MVTFQRILCPIDLSDTSRRALEYASLIARWYRAGIRALLVEPVVMSTVEFPPMPALAGLTPQARQALITRMDQFVAQVAAPGVHVESVLKEGFIVPEILANARELPADLVVMGTHGRGGFEHLVLGSVAEKVLRKLECPVLTVPPGADKVPSVPGPFTSILCATDFSLASLAALEHAISLAQEAGSRLTLVHAVPWELEDQAELLAPPVAEYRRLQEMAARARIEKLVPASIRETCKVDTIVATGRPHEEILRIARDTLADLIVMGVHGRGAVNLAIFGSTTHHVIRHASCPVLTVRTRK